jgi:DNA-binding NtrC family response regulator
MGSSDMRHGSRPGARETEPLVPTLEQRFRLLVLFDDSSWTFPLPERGIVTIGRSDDVDIQLGDPSISRKHTRLHLGPALKVEDLGSANGTRWRGEPLPRKTPVELQPGDPIEIGQTLLVVQRMLSGGNPSWLLTHEHFEARVQEVCGRDVPGKATFAILRVHTGTRSTRDVHRALARALRRDDVAGAYGPGEYELLLIDTTPQDAQARAAQLRGELEGVEDPVTVGVAHFPRDARSPGALLERANLSSRGRAEIPEPPAVTASGMEGLKRVVQRVAESTINVLITGETGVGKGVLAAEIHRRSLRAERPFVAVNCAELQESLLESELFGHERGAFTGASSAKPGLIETAAGGTVFLDEIGEMSLATQAKLLRVLEDRSVRRVGGLQQRPVDVRFVAASNRDLETESERGTFRKDLFFRLNGIPLLIPPLRERLDEMEGLAHRFIAQAAAEAKREAPVLSHEALVALQQYPWPGNIRELKNVLDRAVVLCTGGVINAEHVALDRPRRPANTLQSGDTVRLDDALTGRPFRDERVAERQRIIDALEACAGNQSRAAKLLGISRATLVVRLNFYGLPRPRKRIEWGEGG